MHSTSSFLSKFTWAWLLSLTLITSCQFESTDVLPASTGRPYELMVVMARDKWQGESGQLLRDILTAEVAALPSSEPCFDVLSIPHEAFKNISRNFRNLIMVRIGDPQAGNDIIFQRDLYAAPQLVITISARNPADFKALISKNQGKLVEFLLETERERLLKTHANLLAKPLVDKVRDYSGLAISIPKGYRLNKDSLGFVWFSQESPETSQGFFMYSRPYTSQAEFTEARILAHRDSLLRVHVPGPRKGSYMTTEKEIGIQYKQFRKNDRYYAEVRGLWKVQGDFMGGPFLSLSTLDSTGTRIITLEGYVYAPTRDKRNLFRQVETILYSTIPSAKK